MFPPFRHLRFQQESFWHGCLITCTVQPCGRSGSWTFQHGNVLTWGLFGTGFFLARGIFGTMDISAQDITAPEHFGTLQSNMDILAPVPKCQVSKWWEAFATTSDSFKLVPSFTFYKLVHFHWLCHVIYLVMSSSCPSLAVLKPSWILYSIYRFF